MKSSHKEKIKFLLPSTTAIVLCGNLWADVSYMQLKNYPESSFKVLISELTPNDSKSDQTIGKSSKIQIGASVPLESLLQTPSKGTFREFAKQFEQSPTLAPQTKPLGAYAEVSDEGQNLTWQNIQPETLIRPKPNVGYERLALEQSEKSHVSVATPFNSQLSGNNESDPPEHPQLGQPNPINIDVPADVTHLITVSLKDTRLTSSQEKITLIPQSQGVRLRFEQLADAQVFVRDESMLDWDPKSQQLKALLPGNTEMFVVAQNKMLILPVESKATTPPELVAELSIDPRLHTLDPITQTTASLDQLKVDSTLTRIGLNDTEAEAEVLKDSVYKSVPRLSRSKDAAKWRLLEIQFVDQRSDAQLQNIYPVANLEAKVLGTKFTVISDARGIIQLNDVPFDSHLLIQVQDPTGRYLPIFTEIYTGDSQAPATQQIRMLKSDARDLYASVIGRTQDSQLGSLCGVVIDKANRGIDGLDVRISTGGDGPVYFTSYGPAPAEQTSTSNGRFCFLNVSPQLVEVDFYKNQDLIGSYAVPIIEGTHTEEVFELEQTSDINTNIFVRSSVVNDVYEQEVGGNLFSPIDYTDIVAIGSNRELESLESGLLNSNIGLNYFRSRAFAMAVSPEFEQAIYSYREAKNSEITPLLPRGYVEDLFSNLTQHIDMPAIAYDSTQGVAIVEYGHHSGFNTESIQVRLIDSLGHEKDSGWYYGDGAEVTKAVFFNLEPGIYTAIVTSDKSQWLAATTTIIQDETVSYMTLGNTLKSNPAAD